MKKLAKYLFVTVSSCYWTLVILPAWADLPTPPQADMANGQNDWITVGGGLVYKTLGYVAFILGAVILFGVAATMVKAFHVAHERQDLGHFFKMLIVGLICAALGIGLVYGGYQILPQS